MGARTSNFQNFYFLIEIHCTSMYICLLPQNQLLCQQATIAEVSIYICLLPKHHVFASKPL